MKNAKINSVAAYYSFYIGIIMEAMLVIIDKSAYTNPIEGQIFKLTFLLFCVKIFLTKYTKKEWLVMILFFILGLVSYVFTGRNEIIRLVALIAACKDIDMSRCLKLVFYLTLTGCLLIIFLSVTGIYGSVSLTQDYGRGGVETRYTLGMGHPNALQCMVWAITVLGLFLYGEKMKWHAYCLLLAVNLFFFFLTDSKTSLLAIILTILLSYMVSSRKAAALKKISAWICCGMTIFSIVISITIAANAFRVYNHDWHGENTPATMLFVWLNDLLNGRIRILTETEGYHGTMLTWSLFSRPENTYFFDLGWIRMYYWYGIIPASIFVIVMLLTMLYLFRSKQYMALVLIASFALYNVIEAHAISVYLARNYVFFLIGANWFKIIPGNNIDCKQEWRKPNE